jgi:beta-catenin-like protein 1
MVEDGEEDDGYAGPELPPDFESEDIPDDEEGRFFGGGMERETAQAMNYIDEQDQGEFTVWAAIHRVLGSIADSGIEREIRCRVAQALCLKLREEDIQECRTTGKV